MNISNITNYEPKDFAELLGVSVKTNVGIGTVYSRQIGLLPIDGIILMISIYNLKEYKFSCRLYGLRKYQKQIKEDEEIAKELQDGNKSNE